MLPDENQRTSRNNPHLGPPARERPSTNQVAANIVRGQIDNIYQADANSQASAEQKTIQAASPYDRTHKADRTSIQKEQWNQYHSAWQNYYKQYYERYYLGEVYRMRQRYAQPAPAPTTDNTPTSSVATEAEPAGLATPPVDTETYYDLKYNLLTKVRESAVVVRGSRHFMPIAVAVGVVLLLNFLQFNRILFANVEAYISPGSINPANIIVDPTIDIPVSKDPKLIIPKINVDVPVVYNTTPDQPSQLKAMEGGVAWFGIPGANSRPGQIGNTVLSGHSSNDLFDPGGYKFIFARLDQLVPGDVFYLNYMGTRYTYSITGKEVVRPTDVKALIYDTDKPVVTLITCVPVGTSRDRLLVTAEQVSPNPDEAEAAPERPSNSTKSPAMPGNSPTLLNRVLGG